MNKKAIWIFIVVVALIAVLGIWYYAETHGGTQAPQAAITPIVTPTPSPTPSPAISSSTKAAPVVGEGEHCGGNTLNAPVCAPGYTCTPNPNATSSLPFGDVGGVCAPAGGKG